MHTINHYSRPVAAGRWAIAMLLALGTLAPAQEKTTPEPASAAPQTEMEKWIANTDAKWNAAYKRDITDVHEDELKKLSAQYSAGLEAAIKKASAAGDLEEAVAFRDELKRYAEAKALPIQDADADADVVKQARAVYRAQIARLEKDKTARVVALHDHYDQTLARAQTQLTQHARLEDALLVKKKREEVAAEWLGGGSATSAAGAGEQPKAADVVGENLFRYPNFESGKEGWDLISWAKPKSGKMTVDTSELHNGHPSLRIENANGDFTFVREEVGKPNTHYRLTGYIKTKDVEPVKDGDNSGAVLMVGFTAGVHDGSTEPLQKTNGWTKVSVDFTTTDKTDIKVGPGLGTYSSFVTGTAWFAELSLTEIKSVDK